VADLRPTPRLRWVQIKPVPDSRFGLAQVDFKMLQQWWAEDMPSYMRDQAKGEWRDVPTESE